MGRPTKPLTAPTIAGFTPHSVGDIGFHLRREAGYQLRDMRLQKELTQLGLGQLLGVGETSISSWELGRSSIPPERAAELAGIFNEDPAEFGKFLLRYKEPFIYALLYGIDTPDLKSTLDAYTFLARPAPPSPKHAP